MIDDHACHKLSSSPSQRLTALNAHLAQYIKLDNMGNCPPASFALSGLEHTSNKFFTSASCKKPVGRAPLPLEQDVWEKIPAFTPYWIDWPTKDIMLLVGNTHSVNKYDYAVHQSHHWQKNGARIFKSYGKPPIIQPPSYRPSRSYIFRLDPLK
jgi:hypothetical protein